MMDESALKQRLKTAYQNFKNRVSVEVHDAVMQKLTDIHMQAQRLVDGQDGKLEGHEFAHVLSLLDLVPEGGHKLPTDKSLFPTRVESDGELLGVGQWELLDPDWAISFEQWLIHIDDKASFQDQPQRIPIPDDIDIAICGDWGTGPWKPDAPSTKVATQIVKCAPQLTIHLGDVYYAGTAQEETDNLVECWPMGSMGGFTLNSNHEMYNGAHSYFEIALQKKFVQQRGCSFFCLENSHWLIVGLDTAYDADTFDFYLKGKVNQTQLTWLAQLPKDKKVIVLSHHEGLAIDGRNHGSCYQPVVDALGRAPTFWFWGHLHNGIVYQSQAGMLGRCVGHGAIPYGNARMLQGNPDIAWYETRNANDPNIPLRVKNGFALVQLQAAQLTESMIDEDGGVPFHQVHA
ncbi:metallophosphoesterase [Photobacterium sp. CCB-ST2H9]|uniref:metallophosphoesterase family protein n=1 Tax=Photobacterium sp. CCB-ST2H9 TaxID=2912855 RepID=UPI00200305C0|nr:metallophosphoesterase [Photobacterium sp. CCB-ST2H9]UTM59599.1 metallophosphoesterase [Photobacterium sp. CCB-ST2H9]